MTVAMYIAEYLKIIIPKKWYHNKFIRNNNFDTV